MIETRPATQADILGFLKRHPPETIRAKVIAVDGEVVGLAGYYIVDGVAVVFSESNGAIPKQRIWRESLKFMRGLKLRSICSATETSGPFLKRLGWEYMGPSSNGDMYKFDPKGGM